VIHPTVIIEPGAQIGVDVEIGPYSFIGKDVVLGDRCSLRSHVVIRGCTEIGSDNRFYQFSSIGEDPQDKKYAGEPTLLKIGNNNLFREYCTVNRGTAQDRGATDIGNDNWIMAYCHIAHDCVIGNHCIMSNAASLAGHVVLQDHVILGGFSLIHQFCHIGAHAFSAFGSVINQDVPPFVTVSGHMAEPRGVNAEGLKRNQFSAEAIRDVRSAYKLIYMSGLRLEEALTRIEETLLPKTAELAVLLEFIRNSRRGIVR
jgi:UDP-N-acetylglucosamine acyltransferase